MPKFKMNLVSNRGRAIDDKVSVLIVNGQRTGPLRNERDIKSSSNLFKVDAAPDKYEVQVEVEGFKLFRANVMVGMTMPAEVPLQLTHKCKVLPTFAQLHPTQQHLLGTFNGGGDAEAIWNGLTDSQAATFFQLSHALVNIELANGRAVSSYVKSVLRIGGNEITGPAPNGSLKNAVGWRLHVEINNADRRGIVAALTQEGLFGDQDGSTHSTHSRFGYNKSHRQRGGLPKLQLVLSDDHAGSDVDLDVEFDRSSPHDVHRHFIARFPEVQPIFQF